MTRPAWTPGAWIRGLLSINGGIAIRAIRYGLTDAMDRARQTFLLVDPFGAPSADVSCIPEIDLTQIVTNPPDVLVDSRYATIPGGLGPVELVPLLAIAKHHNPRGVLEIGTFFGSTARNLALNLPDARIHTTDLPPDFAAQTPGRATESTEPGQQLRKDDFHLIEGRRLGAAFANKPEADRIVQHLGDSAVYDFSRIPDAITFFYVDGSHTYEYARSDTVRCMEIAKVPSVLMWHDVNASHPGVVRWIMEMRARGLDVRRIRGTALAYLSFSPEDAAVKRLMSR